MESIPAMSGSLSLPAGVVGNDAHDFIVIEWFADKGGDQTRLQSPVNGRIILVEVAGYDDDRQMGIGFAEFPGQLEAINIRQGKITGMR